MDEAEAYITPDGFGRAAIVRRADGRYCIYQHWQWSEETATAAKVVNWKFIDWRTQPLSLLYDQEDPPTPEQGVFGTVEDARKHIRGMQGFADAVLFRKDGQDI